MVQGLELTELLPLTMLILSAVAGEGDSRDGTRLGAHRVDDSGDRVGPGVLVSALICIVLRYLHSSALSQEHAHRYA